MTSFRLFSLFFFLTGISTLVRAHGDELATDPGVAKDHFTAYGQSDRYELTLYYPELTAGREAHLTIYIADYKTNRPIDKAELSVGTAENAQIAFEAERIAEGVYELHVTFPENKIYTLNVRIAHANGADLIGIPGVEVGKHLHDDSETTAAPASPGYSWLWFLGGLLLGMLAMWYVGRSRNRTLTVLFLLAGAWLSTPSFNPVFAHGDEEHGPKGGGGAYGRSVFAPKETQFLFEIATLPIEIGNYQTASTVYGTIIPSSGGLGAVIAPQAGRITRVTVAVGQTVRAGQTVAILQQNVGTPDQVGIAANNSGLEVQIETARVRTTAAQREYDRLKKIEDIAAAKDVQAAEAALRQATAELNVLENRALSANSSANKRNVEIVAPISGVVGAYTLSAGAEVIAGQTLFSVINLNKVYVEAQVYDRDLSVIRPGNKFLVNCSTDDHKSAEVRLISPAQTMNPGNQSQRVLFEMDNPKGEFKIGEFVTVKALNQESSRHITVPNAALTEINGKTAIFIKEGPEMFSLSYVQTGEDDGSRTLILKGLSEGEKVVVNGAYEVKMMYLNQ